MKKQLIKYFKDLGISVYMHTKARGHQGFFLKNRIDISKNISEERVIPTLLHEFTHYIHNKIEPDMVKTGGNLEKLFQTNDVETIEKELISVTNFVDKHSLCEVFLRHKEQTKSEIKKQEKIIKSEFPKFLRSKKFKEFDKYIKRSKAKYLMRYDRVKYVSPFLRNVEFYSIENIEKDFCDMPKAFAAYIRLKSFTRKQSRISSRINKLKKYYEKPTELFSRFVEGLYIDEARTRACAPYAYQRFYELLEENYYYELKHVFKMLQMDDFTSNLICSGALPKVR